MCVFVQVPPQELSGVQSGLSLIGQGLKGGRDNRFTVGAFSIPVGRNDVPATVPYALDAPTTGANLVRVLGSPGYCARLCQPVCVHVLGTQVRVMRALQLMQPILLEGSPGVGKTSLISALAAASGHTLVCVCSLLLIQPFSPCLSLAIARDFHAFWSAGPH